MEQINILFFVLSSFFGMKEAQIAAEKTIVSVNPVKQEIKLIQENLFTVFLAESETTTIRKQWNKLAQSKDDTTVWATELENFTNKNLELIPINKTFKACITLNYSNTKDLRKLGIWYNDEKKQFSINHIPEQNIKTESGKLEGNYWLFDGDKSFSFSVEPFNEIPEKFKEKMVYISDLLPENK